MAAPTARVTVALALTMLGLASCSSSDGRNGIPRGGCAAPVPTASPTVVRAGDSVEFAVDYSIVDDCVDNFGNGTPLPPPQEGDGIFRDVEVTWSQNGTTQVLSIENADASNRLRTTVTVPDSASAGIATLSAGSADNVLMTVESP